jgi:hypothetical protein
MKIELVIYTLYTLLRTKKRLNFFYSMFDVQSSGFAGLTTGAPGNGAPGFNR